MGGIICNAITKTNPSSAQNPNKKFSFGNDEIPASDTPKEAQAKSNTNKYKSKPKLITNPNNQKEYKIIRLVGRGYYCKVYKCALANETYSIKTILNKKSKDNKDIARSAFNKEVNHIKKDKEIISQLSSQFIIKSIESFSIADKPYIVYPYYNIDLFTILKQAKAIPEPIIQVILLQVYIGLSYMHQRNIIYRDLKPENIMVDTDNGIVKIIDFGLAVKGDNEGVLYKDICGTNEYVSPESIKGIGYNADFDWWGFGIFAYELANGSPPFKGNTQMEIFNSILINELAFRDQTSNELIDLISYLLKKDKDERISQENIPYHPFFRSVDYNAMMTMASNENLKAYLMKYKDYTNIVIDQPTINKTINTNINCDNKANIN